MFLFVLFCITAKILISVSSTKYGEWPAIYQNNFGIKKKCTAFTPFELNHMYNLVFKFKRSK